jgi:hypothetical protein
VKRIDSPQDFLRFIGGLKMEDMRDVVSKKQSELEKMLQTAKLTDNQKKMVLTAAEFGYATAFCEKLCDMQGSFYAAQRYKDAYESTMEKLK